MLDELIQDQIMNQLQQDNATQQAAEAKEEQKPEEGKREETPKETQREYNMRTLRQRAEAAEQRAKELEERVSRPSTQSTQQNTQQNSDEVAIGDDELIEGKHLKKYVSNITKQFERRLEEMNQQAAASAADYRLKSQFQDFDSVVSKDNLKALEMIYPEEYNSVMINPDIYGKAKTAYTMIKNLGIAEGQYHDADRRLSENKTKPRAAASVAPQAADTPLARIGEYRRVLTEDRKEQLRKQVEEAKAFGGS